MKNIIILIWLIVLIAISFLISFWRQAARLAKVNVIIARKDKVVATFPSGGKRIIRKTPAVTRVLECTREETGVGAAIALGSQEEKGNWALLVRAANITHNIPDQKLSKNTRTIAINKK